MALKKIYEFENVIEKIKSSTDKFGNLKLMLEADALLDNLIRTNGDETQMIYKFGKLSSEVTSNLRSNVANRKK